MKSRVVRKSFKDRFEEKFVPEPNSGCWIWIAASYGNGYGHIGRGRRGYGNIKAHRASWELYVGPIPEGLDVCHKCDNPPCVNPKHLFLGTHTDNMRDRVNKGRHHNKKKTHCKNGHEYNEENTMKTKEPHRICKICDRAYKSKWWLSRKSINKV